MRGLRRRLGLSVRRRRQRRYSWRSRRRQGSTRTRVVKFQVQFQPTLQTTTGVAIPFAFSPTQLPGFLDWQTTMSEFRLLKAKIKVAINPGATTTGEPADQQSTFLRVASRPILTTKAISVNPTVETGLENLGVANLFSATINEARQTKFTKQLYPSDDRNVLTFGFYPYTLQWSGKVYNAAANIVGANTQYLEYRSARRWMSMSYLGPTTSPNDDVVFFGPYLFRMASNLPDTQTLAAWSPACLLTVYAQFRGQK